MRGKVYVAANSAMVEAYWNVRREIVEKQGGGELRGGCGKLCAWNGNGAAKKKRGKEMKKPERSTRDNQVLNRRGFLGNLNCAAGGDVSSYDSLVAAIVGLVSEAHGA